MFFKGIVQPNILNIDETLRLRIYDGNFMIALPWYQDEVVYYNSEGITDKLKIPNEEYVEDMFDYLKEKGEVYFIEIKKDGVFTPIGDVTLKEENPPIVIGVPEYRGKGIGKKVMSAIINRAREIGIKRFYNAIIYDYNIASQKMCESLGFKCVEVKGNERVYELIIV